MPLMIHKEPCVFNCRFGYIFSKWCSSENVGNGWHKKNDFKILFYTVALTMYITIQNINGGILTIIILLKYVLRRPTYLIRQTNYFHTTKFSETVPLNILKGWNFPFILLSECLASVLLQIYIFIWSLFTQEFWQILLSNMNIYV